MTLRKDELPNIPRHNTDVKRAIIPKLDALLCFDYKQVEPRLLAFYLHSIGYSRLTEYLHSGVDPYTAIAMGYFGKETLTDAERQLAKQTFLSLSYGGGLPAIRRYFKDLDWQGAKRVKNQFYDAWPEIVELNEIIHRRIAQRGFITTLFGRHLHPESEHKALNALIQGCAADLMRNALIETDQGLESIGAVAHLVSTIHDEIIIDSPLDEVPMLAEKVPQWMDYPQVSEVVPVLVDFEWSKISWADKQKYE